MVTMEGKSFGLRSASGKWSDHGTERLAKVESERNDAKEPQTEAGAPGVNQETSARDERGRCGAEQAMVEGGEQGRDGSVWSAATPALVTALTGVSVGMACESSLAVVAVGP